MEKEMVGRVTDSEKDEIRRLFDRKMALNELLPALRNDLLTDIQKDELYERIISDVAETSNRFNTWWHDKSVKYNWKKVEEGNWHIDFETNEIFLVAN